MAVNAELLRKIADKIEAEPRCYDQHSFSDWENNCGCVAHHAVILSGRKVPFPNNTAHLCIELQGAGHILGLNNDAADIIFHPEWLPRADLTVPHALRLIADGASVESVSAK